MIETLQSRGEDASEYIAEKAKHEGLRDQWRSTETYFKGLGASLPQDWLVFWFDDIDCIRFPHFTNRDIK